jgi:hypothetical protein
MNTPSSPIAKIIDPILQEVWRIKAELNKEANYDVRALARAANALMQSLPTSSRPIPH